MHDSPSTQRRAARGVAPIRRGALVAIGLALVASTMAVAATTPAGAVAPPVAPTTLPPVSTGKVSVPNRVTPTSYNGDVRALTAVPESAPVMLPTRKNAPSNHKTTSSAASTPPVAPSAPGTVGAAKMPAPNATFAGQSFVANGAGFPPDTNGDVGPNNYIQTVNTSVGIYSKTGTPQAVFTFNSLWATSGSGTLCDTSNRGDPVALYDAIADRWIVSDFAFSGSGNAVPFFECIAVSKTSDPVAGGWFFYPLRVDDASHAFLNDYPKLGVWPDGIYMSANEFDSTFTYAEVRLWALNRDDLYSGAALRQVVFDFNATNHFSLQPGNLRGALPPAGTPAYFVAESETSSAFEVFKMAVNWTTVTAVVSGPSIVSQTAYTFNVADPIGVQPGTTAKIDTLRDRIMMQAQYRHLGATESIWVTHTVNDTPTGVQWAQIDVTGGTVAAAPVQQQIFDNGADGQFRYMPSLAVDEAGNMAVGYSNSSATVFPSISYAGRLSTDPLNTLAQGETSFFAGTRSQIFTCGGAPCERWGDYTAMTPDPVLPCTFWYTNEYYSAASASALDWQTRIGSFTMPQCVPQIPAQPVQNVNEGDVVTVNWTGAQSIPAGHTLTPTLSQTAGPVPTFIQTSSATTRKFIAPRTTTAAGDTLSFDLTLTDASTNLKSTKTVVVNVKNNTPVAVAGANRVVLTGSTVVLKGASNDAVEPDTAPAGTTGRQYSWTQTGGVAVTLTPGTGVNFRTASYTPAGAGTSTFSLVVTDHGGTGAASAASPIAIEARVPPTAGTLRGVVSDSLGAALSGVTVDVMTNPAGPVLGTTTTVAGGGFSIGALTNGTAYYVRFSAAGFGTRWALNGIGATGVRPVLAPSAVVDATLTATASLRTVGGTALDSSASAVGGATVLLFDDVGQLASVTTTGAGAYSFAGLTPKANYRVSIARANPTYFEAWATTDGRGSTTGSSGVAALFFDTGPSNVTVPPTTLFTKATQNRTLTVTVQSAGPLPVTGAEVRVYNTNGYVSATRVNTAGVYTLTGLRPESDYKVWVWTKCSGCTSGAFTSQWFSIAPGEQYDQSGKLAALIDLTTSSVPIPFTLT